MYEESRKSPLFYYLQRVLLSGLVAAITYFLLFNGILTISLFLITSLCFDWLIFSKLGKKESMLISEQRLLSLSGSTHENLDTYASFSVSARRRSAPWALCIGWAFYYLSGQALVAVLFVIIPYLIILIPQMLYLKLHLKVKFPYPSSKEPPYQQPHLTDPVPINFLNPASPYYHKSLFD